MNARSSPLLFAALLAACGTSSGGGGAGPSGLGPNDTSDTCDGIPDAVTLVDGLGSGEMTGLDVAEGDVIFSRRSTTANTKDATVERVRVDGQGRSVLFTEDLTSELGGGVAAVAGEAVFLGPVRPAAGESARVIALRAVPVGGGAPRDVGATRFVEDRAMILAKDDDSVYVRAIGLPTDANDTKIRLVRVRVSAGETTPLAEDVADADARVVRGDLFFATRAGTLMRVPVDGSAAPRQVLPVLCGGGLVGEERIVCAGTVYDLDGAALRFIAQAPSSVPTVFLPAPALVRTAYRIPLVPEPRTEGEAAQSKPLRRYAIDADHNTRIGCVRGRTGLTRVGATHIVWNEVFEKGRARLVALPR